MLNKQNKIITYIFELGLTKSVSETKQFMRENSSPYVLIVQNPRPLDLNGFYPKMKSQQH